MPIGAEFNVFCRKVVFGFGLFPASLILWYCFPLHFFRKNEAKKRRCSQIALLSRVFTTTGHTLRD